MQSLSTPAAITKGLPGSKILCRKVGSHRRVLTEDILAWRRATELRRREALDGIGAIRDAWPV